jgi:predicted patatin/cPLA2 family phospholipase
LYLSNINADVVVFVCTILLKIIVEFWGKLSVDIMYGNWPFWIIEGAFWHDSFYNSTIFVDFLAENVPFQKVERKVTVGATNVRTGGFVRFTEEVGRDDLMFKAVRASSAFPGMFGSVDYQNMTLIDGGVVINLDISGAIERCKETVSRDSDITVDIIMCSGDALIDTDASNFNTIEMLKRTYRLLEYQKTMNWIIQGKANHPHVNFRYIIAPVQALNSEWIPIGFKPKEIKRLIEVGKADAAKTIKMGEGKMFEHLTQFWKQSTQSNSDESFQQYMYRYSLKE